MSRRSTGWLFVAIQVALLVTLAILAVSGRDDWPTPPAVLALAGVATLGGLVVIVVAALQLGSALTPTPLPNAHGQLSTSGLYGQVRHPIYSGALMIVIGVALRSASWIAAAVAGVTIVFFHVKARWEERQLTERYPEYPEYAAATPRFVPRVRLRPRTRPATDAAGGPGGTDEPAGG